MDCARPSHGAQGPNGENDLVFDLQTDETVAELYLVVVNSVGQPTGSFQADTLVGLIANPAELGLRPSNAQGLAVSENGIDVSEPNGSLKTMSPGAHRFELCVASSPAIAPGTKLRLYVERGDKSLVTSNVVVR